MRARDRVSEKEISSLISAVNDIPRRYSVRAPLYRIVINVSLLLSSIKKRKHLYPLLDIVISSGIVSSVMAIVFYPRVQEIETKVIARETRKRAPSVESRFYVAHESISSFNISHVFIQQNSHFFDTILIQPTIQQSISKFFDSIFENLNTIFFTWQ